MHTTSRLPLTPTQQKQNRFIRAVVAIYALLLTAAVALMLYANSFLQSAPAREAPENGVRHRIDSPTRSRRDMSEAGGRALNYIVWTSSNN